MGGELNFVPKPSLQNPILCTFQWKKEKKWDSAGHELRILLR